MANPLLSVVIPTLGRPILIQTLQSLIAMKQFGQIEIFVAGKIAEADVQRQLDEIVRAHANIHHLPVAYETGDSSLKKNAGAAQARADYIAFLDDDVVVAPDWAQEILTPFAEEKVGLVSGPSLVPRDLNLIGRLAGRVLASRAAGYVMFRYRQDHEQALPIRWSQIIGCNAVYRKTVFQQMGTFDPAFYPGEEMIASFKTQQLGYQLMFVPAAYVYHYPRSSLRRFWRQIWGYGATRIRLLRAGVDFEPTTLVPGLWVFSLAVLGLGALVWSWARWLLAADLAAYLLVDLLITAESVKESRRPGDLLMALLMPVMHLSYGLAEWSEFLRPNRDLSEPGFRRKKYKVRSQQ